MLGKLIKHEFKATAKLLLPLLAAVLALMGGVPGYLSGGEIAHGAK